MLRACRLDSWILHVETVMKIIFDAINTYGAAGLLGIWLMNGNIALFPCLKLYVSTHQIKDILGIDPQIELKMLSKITQLQPSSYSI